MTEIHLNILLLGDSAVGKTSLLMKYINNEFKDSHIATNGIDYKKKNLQIKNLNIELNLIDTSGNEKTKSISYIYNQDIDGIIFVFDVTNYQSFEKINDYLIELEKSGNDYLYVLVGNKIDLQNIIQVNEEKVLENYKFKKIYFQTSAKENKNVSIPFEELTKLILKKLDEEGSIAYRDENNVKTFRLRKNNLEYNPDIYSSKCCK